MVFLVDLIMEIPLELQSDLVGFRVASGIRVGRTGDDQRSTSFVDQNIVNFVDDRESQFAL